MSIFSACSEIGPFVLTVATGCTGDDASLCSFRFKPVQRLCEVVAVLLVQHHHLTPGAVNAANASGSTLSMSPTTTSVERPVRKHR